MTALGVVVLIAIVVAALAVWVALRETDPKHAGRHRADDHNHPASNDQPKDSQQ